MGKEDWMRKMGPTIRVISILLHSGFFNMNNKDKSGFYYDAQADKKFMMTY